MAKQMVKRTMTDTTRITTAAKGVTKSRTKVMPTEQQIRARAFEIYQRRKGRPGDAHSDWLQAERELTDEYSL